MKDIQSLATDLAKLIRSQQHQISYQNGVLKIDNIAVNIPRARTLSRNGGTSI